MKRLITVARNRGRNTRLFHLCFAFLLVSLHSESAFCASLTVKIRQVNPDGQVQQVTCADNTKCPLSIGLQTGPAQEEPLNVTIVYFPPGGISFEFQTPAGYLYAGDKAASSGEYRTIWSTSSSPDKPSISDVTLFLPSVSHPEVAPILTVAQQPVATLEITTEVAP